MELVLKVNDVESGRFELTTEKVDGEMYLKVTKDGKDYYARLADSPADTSKQIKVGDQYVQSTASSKYISINNATATIGDYISSGNNKFNAQGALVSTVGSYSFKDKSGNTYTTSTEFALSKESNADLQVSLSVENPKQVDENLVCTDEELQKFKTDGDYDYIYPIISSSPQVANLNDEAKLKFCWFLSQSNQEEFLNQLDENLSSEDIINLWESLKHYSFIEYDSVGITVKTGKTVFVDTVLRTFNTISGFSRKFRSTDNFVFNI